MNAVLNIYKPQNWTSHDVVAKFRSITGIRKIGHAGTLDPFAEGVLVVCIGREATKKSAEFMSLPKKYLAEIQLGIETNTHDRTGEIMKTGNADAIVKSDILDVLSVFEGKIEQIPPMFSAKKVNGKKLYEMARQGKNVERKPVEVIIYSIHLIDFLSDRFLISIRCSKGTYIRSIARDLGRKLGCFATLRELKRTAVGEFSSDQSIRKENWESYWKSITA